MSLTEIRKKMLSGEIYDPADKELAPFQLTRIEMVHAFNNTPSTPEGMKTRAKMLKEMFLEIGEDCYIEPPFYANLGCWNVKFGNGVYANFHLTMVDDGEITVGDYTLFGPNVTVATAAHPFNHDLRSRGLQYNLPVHIGKNCWIGSGALIMPGVTIGDNVIIGAGSVVTKDMPSGVIAFGNPCKVHRAITEEDMKSYNHGVAIPEELLKQ